MIPFFMQPKQTIDPDETIIYTLPCLPDSPLRTVLWGSLPEKETPCHMQSISFKSWGLSYRLISFSLSKTSIFPFCIPSPPHIKMNPRTNPLSGCCYCPHQTCCFATSQPRCFLGLAMPLLRDLSRSVLELRKCLLLVLCHHFQKFQSKMKAKNLQIWLVL